jgi:predicted DNA-binding transcriptional regulator YafY
MKRKAAAHAGRKPSYGAATRLARLVHELSSRPNGWSFHAIQESFRISERTLLRYIAACREELTDDSGRPVIEIVKSGPLRALRLARDPMRTESSVYEVASLFFTLTVLSFLEGTVLKGGVDRISERILEGLKPSQRLRLANLEKKFFAVPYAPKDYADCAEHLDLILRALLDQQKLRVAYRAVAGSERTHEFEPYTLVAYRGGLYLLGRSHLGDEIVWLAIERIRTVAFMKDAHGERIHFELPKDYHPARHTEGMFGIVDGPLTKVELLITNPETELFLRSRAIHPSQRFRRRRDGTAVLSMTVRGTTELRNWVMSFGPWLEVLKPASLRAEVAAMAEQMNRRYSRRNAGGGPPSGSANGGAFTLPR